MLYFSTDGCINKSLTYLLTYFVATTTSLTPSRYCTGWWLCVPERVNFKLALMADRVLTSERNGAVVPESTCSGIQPYWSSPSTVVFHTAAARHVIPSVNSRPSLVSPIRSQPLPDDIQSAPSVSAFRRLIKHFCSTIHFLTLFRGLRNSLGYHHKHLTIDIDSGYSP